jgi:hypothetical protein
MNHRELQDQLENGLIIGTALFFTIAAVLFGVLNLLECML